MFNSVQLNLIVLGRIASGGVGLGSGLFRVRERPPLGQQQQPVRSTCWLLTPSLRPVCESGQCSL